VADAIKKKRYSKRNIEGAANKLLPVFLFGGRDVPAVVHKSQPDQKGMNYYGKSQRVKHQR
jgi:hypothetical protein